GTNTLTASSTGLTNVTFTATGTVGSGIVLVFSTSPSGGTGGAAWATQPVVTVRDANGNTVTSNGADIALAITTPNGATLTCTSNPVTATSGVATFAGCKIGKTGTGYTLSATGPSLTTGTSSAFDVTSGAAATISANGGNGQSATVASAVMTAPSVIVKDAGGNAVSGINVTFAVATGGGRVTGGAATTDADGIATVGSWILGAAAGVNSNSLTAASGSLSGSPVTFTATSQIGSATALAFITQPGGGNAGTAWSQQPVVALKDAGGNTVTASSAGVTLAITTPAGATLVCSGNPLYAVNGLATFAGCEIGKAGTGYTLTATGEGVTAAVSSAFNVTAGALHHFAVTATDDAALGNQTAGSAFHVKLVAQDASNNTVTSFTGTVAITATGSTLSGSPVTSGAFTAGVLTSQALTLTTLTVTSLAQLTVSDGGSSAKTGKSAEFSVTSGAATQMVVHVGNGQSAVTSQSVANAPAVLLTDAVGNVVSGAAVTFAVATGGGVLSDSTTATNASGIATLGGWQLGGAPGANTIKAKSTGLSDLTFTATATAGAAAKLAFTTQPAGASAGTVWTTQPAVTVLDANGNTVTNSSASLTLALVASNGATLTCTSNGVATANSGVATFAGCNVDKASAVYTLTATATDLASATSAVFSVAGGAPTQMAMHDAAHTNNQSAVAAQSVATAPAVIVKDVSGNGIFGVTVTFAIASGAGTVTEATATTDDNGIATLGSWTLGAVAGTNTLRATSGTLTGSPVTFTATGTVGAAAKLAFTTSPSNGVSGSPWGTQPAVTVQDASGNSVSASSESVTLSITTPDGAALACTTNPVAASSGVATFAGCSINKAAAGYTLTAAATGLASGVSSAFNVVGGVAAHVVINGGDDQSATVGAAVTTAPSVLVTDASNNPVSGASVTFAVATGSGTITDATRTTNGSGIATVGSWTLGATIGANTVTATVGALTPVTFSASGTIGTASKLAFTTQPSGATAGAAWSTQPVVTVKDAAGNVMTSSSAVITMAFTAANGATLACTADNTLAAASGLATFTACQTTKSGSYTLTATSGTLTAAVSSSFTVAAAAASTMAIHAGGTSQTVGVAAPVGTLPSVIVKDGYGNPTSGVGVSFVVASGGGSVTGGSAT
ncbi:MAG: hypothetical protein NTW72_03290, partial [Gemmatimonadetes bacterium]|nr:hypothetical protein [Gemmatimonadota bacterium]